MKKKYIKLALLITLLIQLCIQTAGSSVTVTMAQFQGGGTGDGGQQLICRGDRDYQSFMSAIISYDGFVEYWRDILVRYNTNICLYEDIESLLNRLTKVRKQIRNAFYSCADESKVERLKRTYYELETMLFFLRKYVDVRNGNFTLRKDEDVMSDLRDFYVFNKGYFTDEKIAELYETFKRRYGTRIKAYQDCTDSTWQQVIDKWNEFKETAGGVTPALKQAKESAEKRWARLSESAEGMGEEFLKDIVVTRINGLPPEEGWGQIAAEFEKNMPGGVTFEELQAAVHQKGQERDYTVLENEYETQYALMYKESSDEITRLMEDRLIKLNSIIEGAFPYTNQTIHCVKDINDHQC